ncbi:probable phosphorylase b kinase regulatory subunit alpha isoform X7 [Littorina saxatilis]|uniref:probable phosphorylase b kinase regulatory subunit alpha isoform X7 n=1 Tax=Littorina saxatilis TaxID=31220 RepID=UPI0038B653D6
MRNRSGSGIRLDYFQRLVNRSILKYQNPATGLIASRHDIEHSWVRDNVYSILSVWGLALAYKKTADLDEDRAKAYELQNAVVMLMRGLLRSMMMQSDKLEKFKKTQSPTDALHAKYCTRTGKTVVGDNEWGHLQIDATSLYLLTLAQMTASGLNIIFTLDEVAFVQNLVFYIETAYRTPDYGIWERGDKTNHGLPELNSSSIGMAKAALEAINELDLFAARGGPASVIYVMPDEAQQCQAILTSMLPRESSSKEVDASLLTVIGFPAFAMDDLSVIKATRDLIHSKLEGKYGCIRFLRDGYKTPREDPNRLYYEPSELMQFENIESQWPIFFALYHLNGLFRNDKEQADKYRQKLDEVMLKTDDGIPYMPELYAVPAEVVHEEIEEKNSQKRVPRGQKPHMWGQSLYILGRLMSENFLSPGELDPLNRRLIREDKPDVVVQVAILAEDAEISHALAKHGIHVQTISQSYPIQVHPARVLSQIFSRLGKSKRLGLSGRPSGEIGLLATSKLYMLDNKIFAFIPQFIDAHQFYMSWDVDFLVDQFQTDMDFLARSWTMLGRPLILFLVSNTMLDYSREMPSALIGTLKKLQSGYISGTRVHMGKLSDFLTTSCMTQLDFLRDQDDPSQKEGNVLDFIDTILSPSCPRPHLLAAAKRARKTSRSVSGQAIYGIVRRSRSIQIDSEQIPGSDGSMPTSPMPQSEEANIPFQFDSENNFQHLRTAVSMHHSHSMTLSGHHNISIPQGNEVNVHELLENLKQSDSLQEQADIIHYLYTHKGPDWDTGIDSQRKCTVRDLLTELYEKAGHWKQWWLVRHTAGMLKKRVEDLAIAATDLVVRQKQLSVGMPPYGEHIITCPLPPDELASIIFNAYAEDSSSASLTQELLIYLAMFIRTEPKLFSEMLRLRVGLIIQVMASEMSRTLQCTGEEASDHLLNLSPFEMKTLLHHILSGKEFHISAIKGQKPAKDVKETLKGESREKKLSIVSRHNKNEVKDFARLSTREKVVSQRDLDLISAPAEPESKKDKGDDRQGQWLRRRRLDGALNRVPVGFYPRIWKVLRRCQGLKIDETTLYRSLTEEMTEGEFKFALEVEIVLNQIPEPEYRQLMVEAMMILATMVENDNCKINMDQIILVDHIVTEANRIYVETQKIPPDILNNCMGARGICFHLYDSAPSGPHGTMTYMCRALARLFNLPVQNGDLECTIS